MTMTTAEPSSEDRTSLALQRLVPVLAEDAIFALAAGGTTVADALEGLGRRRQEAYHAVLQGTSIPRMLEQFDAWVVHLTRAMAPVSPPVWMPMMDVVREKVTLEIGARGLRSLFSTKPSEKDVQRVKRIGALAVRLLRAVFVADGPIQAEEATTLAAVIASLGLPEEDAKALYAEPPVPAETLDVYGELEPAIGRALVRGAWLAAAWSTIDPRAEAVIRNVAQRIGVSAEDVEAGRADAVARVDARRYVGLAAVDGVRFVLSDRAPGIGVQLAATCGTLLVPRRYRDEALAQVGHNAPITLAKRHVALSPDEKAMVLGIAWAAAHVEDPTIGRRALLRTRWERFAADLGDESGRARQVVDEWLGETLAGIARTMR